MNKPTPSLSTPSLKGEAVLDPRSIEFIQWTSLGPSKSYHFQISREETSHFLPCTLKLHPYMPYLNPSSVPFP